MVLLLISHQLSTRRNQTNGTDKFLNSFPFYLTVFILFLFSAFRYKVGADYENYHRIFIQFKLDTAPFEFETMNMFIIDFVNYIGLSTRTIFVIYSAIILYGVYQFISKLSISRELSLIVFFLTGMFYLSTLNGIRQWAAVAMVLLAVVRFIDRKYTSTLFFIVLASLFHKSAAVTVVIFLLHFRLGFKSMLLLASSSLIFLQFVVFLISFAGYERYLIEGLYEQRVSVKLLFTYGFFLIIAPVFLGYFSKGREMERKLVVLLNMNFVSIFILVFGFASGMSAVSVMRMNMYFQMQILILLPVIFASIYPAIIRWFGIAFVIVALSGLFFYTVVVNGDVYKLTPYSISS
ncbi:EpsG family protein [Vibrio diabolicus]|uniref:EpsG family protein n=1 Tax=Vibrio diabolicus TaxID=50719 RepID=UPI001F48C081|nr:EpsG family protein [Vibrio diabolicus]